MTRIKQLFAALFVTMLAVAGSVGGVAAYEDESLPVSDTLTVDGDREHSQILITAAEEGDLDVTVEDDTGTVVHEEVFAGVNEGETVAVDVSGEDSTEFVVSVDQTHPTSMTLVYTGEEYSVTVDEDDVASQLYAEFSAETDAAITVEATDDDGNTTTVVEEQLVHVDIADDEDVGAAEIDVDGDYSEYTLVIEHDDAPSETGYTTGDSGGAGFVGDNDIGAEGLLLVGLFVLFIAAAGAAVASTDQ